MEIFMLILTLMLARVLGRLTGGIMAKRRRDRSRLADPMPLYDTLPPDAATIARVQSIRLETMRRR